MVDGLGRGGGGGGGGEGEREGEREEHATNAIVEITFNLELFETTISKTSANQPYTSANVIYLIYY